MKPLDEIFLPKSSKNEELEDLSRKRFAPLFDEERFILKGEVIDNGIDLRNEIKKNNCKLGFGFNFQLKAKANATKNKDGSYSKSIETKNIEYLLNNGQPAFYGFYIKNEDEFYYVHLKDVIRYLHDKDIDWENQPSHTIRFTDKLNSDAVNRIYQISMQDGIMLREINYRSALIKETDHPSEKIIIDYDKKINSDKEIHDIIEKKGIQWVNLRRWKDVIKLHEKATNQVAISPKYCLTIGMAYYYNGQLLKALPFFKKANSLKNTLEKFLNDYLDYYFLTTKYTVGIIDKKDYGKQLQKLEKNKHLNFFFIIEEAKEKCYANPETYTQNFEKLINRLQSIIDDSHSSSNVKLSCRCEILLHFGLKNNLDYAQSISFLNAFKNNSEDNRTRVLEYLSRIDEKWSHYSFELKKETIEYDPFVYHLALINESKVMYQKEVFSDYIYLTSDIPGEVNKEKTDNTKKVKDLIQKVEHSIDFFKSIEHFDNIIAALGLKYELLKYKSNEKEAVEALKELKIIIEESDSPDTKRRFDYLINQGTIHETFRSFMQEIKGKIKQRIHEDNEREELVLLMKKMDKDEKAYKSNNSPKYHLELFPIGHFEFPQFHITKVLTFLNIDKKIERDYTSMFEMGIVPVCNVFYNPILKEGLNEGNMADKGIESWKRVYVIRKFFFENRYKRVEYLG